MNDIFSPCGEYSLDKCSASEDKLYCTSIICGRKLAVGKSEVTLPLDDDGIYMMTRCSLDSVRSLSASYRIFLLLVKYPRENTARSLNLDPLLASANEEPRRLKLRFMPCVPLL
jgi:hypothetical protein